MILQNFRKRLKSQVFSVQNVNFNELILIVVKKIIITKRKIDRSEI